MTVMHKGPALFSVHGVLGNGLSGNTFYADFLCLLEPFGRLAQCQCYFLQRDKCLSTSVHLEIVLLC